VHPSVSTSITIVNGQMRRTKEVTFTFVYQLQIGEPGPIEIGPFAVETVARFDKPWALSFLPDGRLLVSEKAGTLQLVDVASGEAGEVTGVPGVPHGGPGRVRERGPHEARVDRRDRDALAPELHPEPLEPGRKRGFGRGVRRGDGHAAPGREARHTGDVAGSALQHGGQARRHRVDDAEEVHAEHLLDACDVERLGGRGVAGTSVRDEHLGRAPRVAHTVDDGKGLSNWRHRSETAVRIDRAPVAMAGENRIACTGDVLAFDGSKSSDPEGGVVLGTGRPRGL